LQTQTFTKHFLTTKVHITETHFFQSTSIFV